MARLVGAPPTSVVVSAHGPARLVPRRRAGRRHTARDAGRGDAGRRRPTRGTRRPPVATHGPALACGDRHLARAPRSRRGRPRRVAVAGRRCGDRPDATGAGDRRADDAGDGPPTRCSASSGPGGTPLRARTSPPPHPLARPRRLARREPAPTRRRRARELRRDRPPAHRRLRVGGHAMAAAARGRGAQGRPPWLLRSGPGGASSGCFGPASP